MKVEEIKQIARKYGLKPGRMSKTVLVRTIQAEEGNFTCFGTAVDATCDQIGCLWRKDCFEAATKPQ